MHAATRRSLALATAVAALLGASSAADAHVRVYPRPYRPHYYGGAAVAVVPSNWYVGFGLTGTRILDQSGGTEQLESGAGFALWCGLRVVERLSLELGWSESFHNPAPVNTWYGPDTDYLVLDAWTADARIHLGKSGSFDPYVQGGVGLYALGSQYFGMDSVGTGFQLGAGFDFWLGDYWTLGVRAKYAGISMGPPDSNQNDLFISAASVEGSIGLHF